MAIMGAPSINNVGRTICKALRLNPTGVHDIEIHVAVGKIAEVRIKRWLRKDELSPMIKMIEKYHLVPLKEEKQ